METKASRGIAKNGSQSDEGKALQSWKGVTSLTNKERDEIEFQVKVMIKRCLARIKELEKGEESE
jgi:syntaxin 18